MQMDVAASWLRHRELDLGRRKTAPLLHLRLGGAQPLVLSYTYCRVHCHPPLSVISLMKTLEQLLHPQHSDLRIHKFVKTFQNKLCILRYFVQNSCGRGNRSKSLEIKIINVACKADDIIGTNLLDIQNEVKGARKRFRDELGKLTVEIHSVMNEVTKFEKKGKQLVVGTEGGRPHNSTHPSSQAAVVVGLDDDFTIMIKD